MSTVQTASGVGELLRDWRQRRGRSQLDVSLAAAVSTRHLSYVETGRSRPSRELVLHLAEHLDVPLREQNTLLLAAGYAPVYTESSLDADAMAPARAAIDTILSSHAPAPALVVDGRWNLVSANGPAVALVTEGVAPHLLEPPVNTLRVALHPDGVAPRIVNLADYGHHLLMRLRRQALLSADAWLDDLADELAGYPGVSEPVTAAAEPDALVFSPLQIRSGDRELLLFGTLTTFGTALDVTLAELSIEAYFPGHDATRAALAAGIG